MAGGYGRRIGSPKALLKIESQTYLEKAVENCLGCKDIIIIVNPLVEAYCFNHYSNMKIVVNSTPESGMIESIVLGLNYSDDNYYLIYPVDFPYVKKETVDLLVNSSHDFDVIKPVFSNKSGHPIAISNAVKLSILENPLVPLYEQIKKRKTLHVLCDDIGIYRNVNYKRDIKGYENE